MVTGLLQSALLFSMETCVNRVLSLDTGALDKLKPVAGKSLRVLIEKPRLSFTILVGDGMVHLHQDESTEADTTIRGKASSILKLVVKRDTHSLHAEGIVITGKTSLLETLQTVFQDLDLDWEYELSKYIGDIPTQAVSDGLTGVRKAATNTKRSAIQNIDEYLHEETNAFPTMAEATGFYHSIDALRLRVDRLQSRVDRLQTS